MTSTQTPSPSPSPLPTPTPNPSPILVVGLGSPHGDDQAGWITAEAVRSWLRQNTAPSEHITIACRTSPIDLLHDLPMYSTVFLCDCAKLSPQPPSTPHFFRITVPRPWTAATLLRLFADNRIGTSSHGIQLGQVLELAEIQGKFPGSEAVIYAIPGCQFSPMAVPTAATIHATTAAALQILTDLGCNPGGSIGTIHPELGPVLLR